MNLKIAILLYLVTMFSVTQAAVSNKSLSGTLVVVNKSGDSVSLIDLQSGRRVIELPTGPGPHELAISRDGRWAVTTNYVGGNSLTVIDIAGKKVSATVDLNKYPRPHGIQFLTDQNQVAVTSEGADMVVVADIHRAQVSHAIGTGQAGSHMLALTGDSDTCFTSNMRDDSLSVIDLAEGKLIKTIASAATPEAITTNKAGSEVWYGANRTGQVIVIDTQSGEQLAEWSGFGFPYRILLSHNEKTAIVPDFRKHQIRFFDVENKTELQSMSLADGAGPQGVSLHPEQDLLFLSLRSANKVLAIDLTSRTVVAEFGQVSGPDGIAWSPLVLTDR